MKDIVKMHQVDLSAVDLNLLKLFEALVRERSVTQAGLRLGLSQPAASRALGRLRAMLGDRLVVRGKLGLELTPRGEMLAGPVARLLDDARGLVSPAVFDPASATGRITIAAHDHLSLLVLAGLIARFERHAPALSLHIAQPAGDNMRLVEQGTADLALGIFDALPGSLYRRGLYSDSFVCVVRVTTVSGVASIEAIRSGLRWKSSEAWPSRCSNGSSGSAGSWRTSPTTCERR